MILEVFSRRPPSPLPAARLQRIAQTVLAAERARVPEQLTVIFTDAAETRELNRRFRGEDHPTDVIAFRYEGTLDSRGWSGDIFINVPQAREQALRFRHSFRRELTLLMIHGILHLLGYADERKTPRRRMFRRQAALLRRLLNSGRN